MHTLGIDLGTTFTKTSNERIFPSGISENIYSNNNVLEFEGSKFAVGLMNHKSLFDTNINKSRNRNIKVNYLYALFQESSEDENIFDSVVLGLPCSMWKKNETVKQFKELLSIPDNSIIKLNGKEKTITVLNIDVIPEGSGAYYLINYLKFNGRKVLVCDIGSLTINQLLFQNDELVDMHTDEFGVLKVFTEMAEKITSDTGIDVKMEDIPDVLDYGCLEYTANDIEEMIKPIVKNYAEMIKKKLNIRWSLGTIPYILLIGGGSIVMYRYLKEIEPKCELLDNPQLLAAIGMNE